MRMMGQHPLPDLYHLGIKVTMNTDDPSVSDTTLADEYYLAVSAMGVQMSELKTMVMIAAESAFLPANEKAALVERMRKELGV